MEDSCDSLDKKGQEIRKLDINWQLTSSLLSGSNLAGKNEKARDVSPVLLDSCCSQERAAG